LLVGYPTLWPKEEIMSILSKPIEKLSPESEPQMAEGYVRREEIELRAYQIYVQRGGADGQSVDDWLQAERELIEEYGRRGQKAKAAAA
jgi:Protein of unknown function (DUF2934)